MKNEKGLNAKSFHKMLYMFLGGVVCVTLLASAYLIFALNNVSREVSKNKYISMNNNKKIEALAGLEGSLRDMSLEESKLEQYLPEEKEVSKILKDIEGMATKNLLSFSAYQVGGSQSKSASSSKDKPDGSQTQKADGYNIFPFQVTLHGSYAGVNSVLKDMENYGRLVEIRDVKYSKDITVSGDVVDAVLQVNAYLKK
ncbi:MAG: type 4a pilus biogenesis protein PilO [bacterium]|nr:type 4a pilus biogenesis protein PilO [bacterium]